VWEGSVLQICEIWLHAFTEYQQLLISEWPAEWPMQFNSTPTWLSKSDNGLYGSTAPDDFELHAAHWEGECR
jgi:hypothetical protein